MSDGQTTTTASPPITNHRAPTTGLHSNQKAVAPRTPRLRRLVSALHCCSAIKKGGIRSRRPSPCQISVVAGLPDLLNLWITPVRARKMAGSSGRLETPLPGSHRRSSEPQKSRMQRLWNTCLRRLEQELPAQQFNTWIRPLAPEEGDETLAKTLVLAAPNRFVLELVRDRFASRIERLATEESGRELLVKLVLSKPVEQAPRPSMPNVVPGPPATPVPRERGRCGTSRTRQDRNPAGGP